MPDEMKELLDTLNTCKCCDAPLHQVDPEDICMVCVDMGCNVKGYE